MSVRETANEILAEIETSTFQINKIEKMVEEEIDAIRQRYGRTIEAHKTIIKSREKTLTALMKKNKAQIFGKRDKVKLEHGILLYGEKDHVQIPRDALEKLQELRWNDGITWTPSLNRPAVEGWNDERLAAIGAEKKNKKSYTYELLKKKDLHSA